MIEPSFDHLLGSWSLDPALAAGLALAAAIYALGVERLRRRRARSSWPAWRSASFAAGLATLAVALESGVDQIGDRELLSVHTAQHMLLALLAPTLLLYGAPVRLALTAGSRRLRSLIGASLSSAPIRLLSRPSVGCALFAAVMLLTHLRAIFDPALEDPALHAFEHAAYFWSGVLLLAPLIAADPLPHPPGALARFCWLMGAMSAMAIPGALLTFANSVSYPFYAAPARLLGRSALSDEHLAGAIMWVGSGIATLTLALWVTFDAMRKEERRQRLREHYERRAERWQVGVRT
jgi:cytochrome c oxidase assembly factor CtaG